MTPVQDATLNILYIQANYLIPTGINFTQLK